MHTLVIALDLGIQCAFPATAGMLASISRSWSIRMPTCVGDDIIVELYKARRPPLHVRQVTGHVEMSRAGKRCQVGRFADSHASRTSRGLSTGGCHLSLQLPFHAMADNLNLTNKSTALILCESSQSLYSIVMAHDLDLNMFKTSQLLYTLRMLSSYLTLAIGILEQIFRELRQVEN